MFDGILKTVGQWVDSRLRQAKAGAPLQTPQEEWDAIKIRQRRVQKLLTLEAQVARGRLKRRP